MDRRAKQKVILTGWLVVFFLLGYVVWELQAGYLIVVAYFLASIVIYWLYAFSTKCPNCRKPVLLRPRRFLGIEFYTWSYIIPEKCNHCGKLLN